MSAENRMKLAGQYVGQYIALKAEIAAKEAEAEVLRRNVVEAIGPDGAAPGQRWEFPGVGVVQVVKGRSSEKLDRAILAQRGVSAADLDAATVRGEGKPSMRISAAADEPEAA